MSNPAQDEFDALVSLKEKPSHHPDDGDSTSSETEDTNSSTLVPPSASQSQYSKSLRSSTHRDSSGEDSDADNEVARRTSRPYYIPSKHGYDANTGPKGVIADARAFENEKRAGNKATYVRTENMVLPKMQRLALGAGQREARDGADDEDEDEDAMDSEGEDDYVRRWRERRAGELRTRKNSAIAAGSGGGRRGRYGSLRGVDAMGFLAAVEESSAGTVVVVFVFDDQLPLSDAYQAHTEALAAKFADVCFIALHYEEAEMEHAGVPALLAYRNGDQFASLTPLKDEVPLSATALARLEEVLRSRGVL